MKSLWGAELRATCFRFRVKCVGFGSGSSCETSRFAELGLLSVVKSSSWADCRVLIIGFLDGLWA